MFFNKQLRNNEKVQFNLNLFPKIKIYGKKYYMK